jgi:hypothetical protein
MTYDGTKTGLKLYVNAVVDDTIIEAGTYVKQTNNTNIVSIGRLRSSSSLNADMQMYGLTFAKGVEWTSEEVNNAYQIQRIGNELI